jgi:hypothetical protein
MMLGVEHNLQQVVTCATCVWVVEARGCLPYSYPVSYVRHVLSHSTVQFSRRGYRGAREGK